MKLIVFKSNEYVNKYKKELFRNCNVHYSKRYSNSPVSGVLWVNSVVKRHSFLRGYTFTDVLFVGYENRLEVVGKCPVDLLAQTHGAKHHYCKPAEPQNSSSKPSYTLNPPNGSSVDYQTLTNKVIDVGDIQFEYLAPMPPEEDDDSTKR